MSGLVQSRCARRAAPWSRPLIAAALLVALWYVNHAGAWTTWYVCSGITGADPGGITGADAAFFGAASDSNAGTDPAFPLRTLGAGGLQSRMADGDTAYISGRFYVPDATTIAYSVPLFCNQRTFSQWPGMPTAMIRGGNKAGAAGWVPVGTAAFRKNIGASLGATLATVVFDYDSAANIRPLESGSGVDPTLGRRASHLTPATEAAVLAAAPDRTSGVYFYDSATGFLSVCLPGGASPNAPGANGIEYSVRGRNAFFLNSAYGLEGVSTGNVFAGLRFALWADSATGSPRGTPVVVNNSDSAVITGCVFEDSGIHAYSFGVRCTNNVCSNNVHIGLAPGGIACVFNAGGTTAGVINAAKGCRIHNDTVYANSFLAHDGTLANRGSAVGGFICHGPVLDVELENFQVWEYTPPGGAQPDGCAQFTVADAPVPPEAFDPNAYAVRVRQTDPEIATIGSGTAWPGQGIVSNAAYINCVFRFPRLATVPTGSMIDLSPCTGTTGFFGCEFTADLGNPSRSVAMFSIGARSNVVHVNSSGLDTGSSHGPNKYAIYRYAARGGFVYDFQSVWGFGSVTGGTRSVCIGDAAIGSGYHWFQDDAFWNIGAATYSDNPAFNTAAEWSTVIDPVLGGVTLHLAADPFLDATGVAGLALDESFRETKKSIGIHVDYGVNGLPYDGCYGAHQYGVYCAADVDVNGFVNADDFDSFMYEYFWGTPGADFDQNGFVNGDDFDSFMDHFSAGC